MYYEELAGRLLGLVIRLEGRIPAEQTEWLHEVTRVGEYGLALDDMAVAVRALRSLLQRGGYRGPCGR